MGDKLVNVVKEEMSNVRETEEAKIKKQLAHMKRVSQKATARLIDEAQKKLIGEMETKIAEAKARCEKKLPEPKKPSKDKKEDSKDAKDTKTDKVEEKPNGGKKACPDCGEFVPPEKMVKVTLGSGA